MDQYQSLPRITFRQLEVLRAVYRERSFTNAALDLRSTRGTVKRMCQDLEKILGGTLFDLEEAGILSPTPFADAMVGQLGPLIRSVRKLEDSVAMMHQTGRVLRLAASPELFESTWFTGFLRRFRSKCPFRVCCLMFDDRRFQSALLNAECDVFLNRGLEASEKLETVDLSTSTEQHSAYLRRNHPYTELKSLLESAAHGI
jgi:DNA-binding transcriptional LysR family regulator